MDNLLVHRLHCLTRHIDHVRANCHRLALYFIENGELTNAADLTARGYRHDQSKFSGVEWAYLHQDMKDAYPEQFAEALRHHRAANDHHPEFWVSIHAMPRPALAEFVCDTLARAQEFGSDIWEWVTETAMPRYGLTQDSAAYDQVREFLNHLLERRFS